MKITLFFFIFSSLSSLFFTHLKASDIKCPDLKKIPIIGSLFVISSKTNHQLQVNFFLSTNKIREPVELRNSDLTPLQYLELSKKTIVIIHGYKSGGRKNWVLQMKDKLLDFQEANVLLVDWSQGSYSKNYVSAAKNTEIVANRLLSSRYIKKAYALRELNQECSNRTLIALNFAVGDNYVRSESFSINLPDFLQSTKAQVEIVNHTSNEILWNNLHFIGHSLGAQISGQIAHLLKNDPFWKIKRITGLDPAKPCFKDIIPFLRLDKDDADFVDIIHTQAGNGGKTDGLGLKESIGHMDFYVNGGVVQPECVGSSLTPRWNTMICSHKLAYKYFTESITNAMNNSCKFVGYPWDGTSENALQILTSKIIDEPCFDCPEMGINAIKSNQRGQFLVIAAAKEPHCEFTLDDINSVANVIKRLKD